MIDCEAAYRRYAPMVLRRCRRLLGDDETAVDAMQETFVSLVRHAPRMEERGLSSLLFRMATNTCLNTLRTRRRRPEDGGNDDLLQRIASADDPTERSIGRLWIDRVLGRVDASSRALAVMHLIDGMTVDEIAAETNLSASSVKRRLRVLRELGKELAE